MPRYFFHTHPDTRFSYDKGFDCTGPVEARQKAIRTCGQLLKDGADAFWGSRPWNITVTDTAGLILWEITADGFASPAAR